MTYLSAVRNINAHIQNVETKAPVSNATRQHQSSFCFGSKTTVSARKQANKRLSGRFFVFCTFDCTIEKLIESIKNGGLRPVTAPLPQQGIACQLRRTRLYKSVQKACTAPMPRLT